MKLGELARSLDTTTASIKFYIREGLLPAGRKINQTTAVYDESHRRRLALILGLRGVIGTPLARIADLIAVIDDPAAGRLDVMETAQMIGVEGRNGDVDARPVGASAAVARVLEEQDWPDAQSQARAAVERRLVRMHANGVHVSPQTLSRIATAVGSIGLMGLDVSGTRDEVALGVAVGTYEVSQLVVDMLSLAQTSHSIRGVGP